MGSLAPSAIMVWFSGPAKQRRLTVLVRIALAIPHFVCLYFAAVAAHVILVIGWFGALAAGRLPQFAAEYLSGYLRWKIRLYAYLLLLTDEYPPFTLRDDNYPVRVLMRPAQLNRAAVLFRIILVIPAEIVAGLVILGLTTIVAFFTWLIVLVTGRMPQPLHQAISAAVRYQARVRGHFYLLTSAFPDGLFGDQPSPDPAAAAAGLAFGWPAPPDQEMWPLVMSRPARRLVGMFISLGAVIIAGPVLVSALVPASRDASPPERAAAVPAATAPLSSREVAWLGGISTLQSTMEGAMGSGSVTITSASLRSMASQLRHCAADLARLGPADSQLQPVYLIASQGCAQYERGAADAAAAARIPLGPDGGVPAGSASAKLNRLLDSSLADVNEGSASMANAVQLGDEMQ